ncbi:bifunctional phosphoribosylaminoimidazolecarboxamide formyltransferase/IMP cyclohydrolase [Candidatus Manganitrophus noduliformans]|uniref:Bifunctional purine biosynthesis protein PurH n=1 Tax=Candidatus Manganitrophus noduliformans TaxID=2606439 RepID=A0A7X6IB16_9BACT|nr:bifunctional phosphoribosylaminoimidazolecarboxamide formyltransferase/IMP cyclohydrolase [Candidatus Manganitrophus noduliformans]NKE71016.1 bifunctional phosphoribosylaminoimidazolecarboxamide formyltransferase/IMP cyclohydrolase [Candidatus Manganitrophus noduliformans]
MGRIRRAILSVYDKEGIVDFAQGLQSLGVEILSTGGTYKLLKEKGIQVKEVSEHTGFPEMLDGRVKTLHPKIHGGILGRRDDPKHLEQMKTQGIEPIDLVAVNLYPFKATIAKPNVTLEEAIENIDIGGPTMLRSAAKNYKDVAVIIDPKDYAAVLDEMKRSGGEISEAKRYDLAKKVFFTTSDYDRTISSYLEGREGKAERFPDHLVLQFEKVQSLRYGENPHQQAAFYREPQLTEGGVAAAKQIWGKEMSYNNFLDTHSAFELVKEFKEPAAVIIKHNNPCGVATGATLVEAYKKAKATDPVSAFGGVAAFNRPLDAETAQEITTTFMEVIIAPTIDPAAATLFQKKKDLRVLEAGSKSINATNAGRLDFRRIGGGLLVQDTDSAMIHDPKELKIVSKRPPTQEEIEAMLFAWKVCKHVKSNAIIFARPGQTVGIGAGQMSRVDSVKLATIKAQMPVSGCVMASDAFFPFRDGIDAAAQVGITAVIQPGGSIRDQEIIQAVDEQNLAMVLTGFRHFRH